MCLNRLQSNESFFNDKLAASSTLVTVFAGNVLYVSINHDKMNAPDINHLMCPAIIACGVSQFTNLIGCIDPKAFSVGIPMLFVSAPMLFATGFLSFTDLPFWAPPLITTTTTVAMVAAAFKISDWCKNGCSLWSRSSSSHESLNDEIDEQHYLQPSFITK